jgi:hypothetical protein
MQEDQRRRQELRMFRAGLFDITDDDYEEDLHIGNDPSSGIENRVSSF